MQITAISSIEKRLPGIIKVVAGVAIIGFLVWFFMFNNTDPIINEERRLNSMEIGDPPKIPKQETSPVIQGTIKIASNTFSFNPGEVLTVRPDIFNPGFFSMFDVLVYLENQGKIDLQYHFDESMNTHVIDSLNNEKLVVSNILQWWLVRNECFSSRSLSMERRHNVNLL